MPSVKSSAPRRLRLGLRLRPRRRSAGLLLLAGAVRRLRLRLRLRPRRRRAGLLLLAGAPRRLRNPLRKADRHPTRGPSRAARSRKIPSVFAVLNQIETAAKQGDRSAQILDGQIQNAARILNQSPGGVNPGNQTPFFSADPTLAGAPVWQVVGAASQEDYDALVSKIANAWNQGDPAAAPIIQMMTDAFSGGAAPVPIFLFAQDVYARAAQLAAPGTQADPLMAKVTSLINALGAAAVAPAVQTLPAFSADPIALNPTLLSHGTALAQAVLAGHPLSPQIMQTLNQGVTECNPLLTALAHAVTGLGQGLGGMLPPAVTGLGQGLGGMLPPAVTGLGQGLGGMLPPAAPGLGSTPLGDAGTLLTTVENMAAQALDVTPLSQL